MTDVAALFREYVRLDRERRAGALLPDELEQWMRVDFASVEELRGHVMTNISRGGLFVATKTFLDIGTPRTLQINIGSNGERIEVPVEGVSHDVGPHFEQDAHGMGMRFLALEPAEQARIEALYDAALREAFARQAER